MSYAATGAVTARRIPATRPPPSHDGRKRLSRFSLRTAKQAGHLLFEIFVEIFPWRCRRLTRFRLCVEFGLVFGFELQLRLWFEFRLDTGLEVAYRRTRRQVAGFARRASQRIGHGWSAFRRRGAAQGGLELLGHFREIMVRLRRQL